MKFQKDFIWGAATSSYQIEGAAYHEGGGHSVWDMLCQQAGKIATAASAATSVHCWVTNSRNNSMIVFCLYLLRGLLGS